MVPAWLLPIASFGGACFAIGILTARPRIYWLALLLLALVGIVTVVEGQLLPARVIDRLEEGQPGRP